MAMTYLSNVLNPSKATTRESIAPDQIKNSDGNYVWAASSAQRVRRFLILGSEGGSYYAGERDLTKENMDAILGAIQEDGVRVVTEVVQVSDGGLAPKNDPALFVLALCASRGDTDTRRAAMAALPKVARTGTHLFHFVAYVDQLRGWGRALREGIAQWYTVRNHDSLAYQLTKYQQRDGWSHRDLIRLSHPKATSETQNELLRYAVKGWEGVGDDPHPNDVLAKIWAHEKAKTADEAELLRLIVKYGLPMESVPNDKKTPDVYAAIMQQANIGWLLRNLGNITKKGVVGLGKWGGIETLVKRLTDDHYLRTARIHPLAVLQAMAVYSTGKSVKGSGAWTPVQEVIDALDAAFYKCFAGIPATGRRIVIGLDISPSMESGQCAGLTGISPRVASAAMMMALKRVESKCIVTAFSGGLIPMNISVNDSLTTVIAKMRLLQYSDTDCALPMTWAQGNGIEADAFIIFTDSETNARRIHPAQALRNYRKVMNIPEAKLAVCAMLPNKFTIADPNDAGMLDLVGADASMPQIIAAFLEGAI